MKNFKSFLSKTPIRNVHLEHIEDKVFEGPDQIQFVIRLLSDLKNSLYENNTSNVKIKWDGKPSIVCGINPENRQFFLGTKSVFSKNPKINYNIDDIQKNYTSPDLKEKLSEAFLKLHKLRFDGVYQGDLLYTKKDLFETKNAITFSPNTIQYFIQKNTEEYKKIKESDLGIVFHTKYVGNKLSEMNAIYDFNFSMSSPNVYFISNKINTTSLTSLENTCLSEIFRVIRLLIPEETNQNLYSGKIKEMLKQYTNYCIRTNQEIKPTNECFNNFLLFVDYKFSKEINELKTERGKQNKTHNLKNTTLCIETYKEEILNLFELFDLISECKLVLMEKFSNYHNIKSYINEEIKFEGLVVYENNYAVKLVDRKKFSKFNFLKND